MTKRAERRGLEREAAQQVSWAHKLSSSRLRRAVQVFLEEDDGVFRRYSMRLGPEQIGFMNVRNANGQIEFARVKSRFRGMGLGKKLYGDVARTLPDRTLKSDSVLSHEAQRLWAALEAKENRDVRRVASDVLTRPDGSQVSRSKTNLFEMRLPEEARSTARPDPFSWTPQPKTSGLLSALKGHPKATALAALGLAGAAGGTAYHLHRENLKKDQRLFGGAVIFNDQGEVLAVHPRKSPGLELPGGKIDPGESWLDGIKREVKEEAGVDFEPIGKPLVQTFEKADFGMKPGKGYMKTYLGRALGEPEITRPYEILDVRYVPAEEVRKGRMKDEQFKRIMYFAARDGLPVKMSGTSLQKSALSAALGTGLVLARRARQEREQNEQQLKTSRVRRSVKLLLESERQKTKR